MNLLTLNALLNQYTERMLILSRCYWVRHCLNELTFNAYLAGIREYHCAPCGQWVSSWGLLCSQNSGPPGRKEGTGLPGFP